MTLGAAAFIIAEYVGEGATQKVGLVGKGVPDPSASPQSLRVFERALVYALADWRKLAQGLGVDAIVVGTVTDSSGAPVIGAQVTAWTTPLKSGDEYDESYATTQFTDGQSPNVSLLDLTFSSEHPTSREAINDTLRKAASEAAAPSRVTVIVVLMKRARRRCTTRRTTSAMPDASFAMRRSPPPRSSSPCQPSGRRRASAASPSSKARWR